MLRRTASSRAYEHKSISHTCSSFSPVFVDKSKQTSVRSTLAVRLECNREVVGYHLASSAQQTAQRSPALSSETAGFAVPPADRQCLVSRVEGRGCCVPRFPETERHVATSGRYQPQWSAQGAAATSPPSQSLHHHIPSLAKGPGGVGREG